MTYRINNIKVLSIFQPLAKNWLSLYFLTIIIELFYNGIIIRKF